MCLIGILSATGLLIRLKSGPDLPSFALASLQVKTGGIQPPAAFWPKGIAADFQAD
jgi:hypothetical protein